MSSEEDAGFKVVHAQDPEANAAFPPNLVKTSRYNPVTFVPIFLLEQLNPRNKFANFYFFCVAMLQMVPSISITGGLPSVLVPLLFVLFVEGVNVAIEDYNRHKADDEANATPTAVFNPSTRSWDDVTWRDIRVGDLVRVEQDAIFPADLLFLFAGNKKQPGHCQVNTKSLDGESDNKLRLALKSSAHNLFTNDDLADFHARVECEHPNENTSDFQGTLVWETAETGREAIDVGSMLLRGCILKNVPYVVGMVVSTAIDTKIEFSARTTGAGAKTASINRIINREIMVLAVAELTLCLVGSIGYAVFNAGAYDKHTYLEWNNEGVGGFVRMFFTYFLLTYQIIPVSLYVSMSMVYTIQRLFMTQDMRMYDTHNEEPALVRTMNLNDELGQVSYIFSDKTGTLTSNLMEMRKCFVDGVAYGRGTTEIGLARMKSEGKDSTEEELLLEQEAMRPPRYGVDRYVNFTDGSERDPNERLLTAIQDKGRRGNLLREFARNMAVNHTVFLTTGKSPAGEVFTELSASSPDEQAFVASARRFGFELVGRDTDEGTVTVREPDGDRTYTIVEVLEYVSYRKRMSVIVRSDTGIKLYCKGADSIIFERLREDTDRDALRAMRHQLGEWAEDALRTLVFASRELTEEEFEAWRRRFVEAKNDPEQRALRKAGRPNAIDALMDEAEMDLTLQGATAVEDKLQLGVPRTLARLGEAGIKIWMITGDKVGTAKNIAVACSLLGDHMEWLEVTEDALATTALGEGQMALEDLKGKKLVDAQNLVDEGDSAGGHRALSALEREFPALSEVRKRLQDMRKQMEEREAASGSAPGAAPEVALIIDEKCIDFALMACKDDLLAVSRRCASVVACRARKDQKKKLLELVRDGVPGTITLGIGDGANDVDMIKAGHIGVGVIGKEGMQAVNNSDYAIGQFRFLQHLLLRHGRSNYRRMAKLVCFMFYKNIMLVAAQFLFQAHSGFSGQKIYAEMGLQFYNTAFTALLVIMMAVYDEDVQSRESVPRQDEEDEEDEDASWDSATGEAAAASGGFGAQQSSSGASPRRGNEGRSVGPDPAPDAVLPSGSGSTPGGAGATAAPGPRRAGRPICFPLEFPELYRMGMEQRHLTHAVFWSWQAAAVYSAVIIFYTTDLTLAGSAGDGSDPGLWEFGAYVMTLVTWVANFKIMLETRKLHWSFLVILVLSDLSWLLCATVISLLPTLEANFFGVIGHLVSSPTFWLIQPVGCALCLFRDVAWKAIRREWFPEYYHCVQEVEKLKLPLSRLKRHVAPRVAPPAGSEEVRGKAPPTSGGEAEKPAAAAAHTGTPPVQGATPLTSGAAGDEEAARRRPSAAGRKFVGAVSAVRAARWFSGARSNTLYANDDSSARIMSSFLAGHGYSDSPNPDPEK